MSQFAIDGVGKNVVVVKDDKVIAKGRSVAMRGLEYVSIQLSDEDFEKFFAAMDDSTKSVLKSIGHIRVAPVTGGFLALSLDLEEDHKDIADQFENTNVVDHFNLTYGMVPDFFKNVEGYRSAVE